MVLRSRWKEIKREGASSGGKVSKEDQMSTGLIIEKGAGGCSWQTARLNFLGRIFVQLLRLLRDNEKTLIVPGIFKNQVHLLFIAF